MLLAHLGIGASCTKAEVDLVTNCHVQILSELGWKLDFIGAKNYGRPVIANTHLDLQFSVDQSHGLVRIHTLWVFV